MCDHDTSTSSSDWATWQTGSQKKPVLYWKEVPTLECMDKVGGGGGGVEI